MKYGGELSGRFKRVTCFEHIDDGNDKGNWADYPASTEFRSRQEESSRKVLNGFFL
jgi:hypothetical protein